MRLLTPGPVPVPHAVLKLFSEPVLHHRTPEFESIFTRALSGLKKVFQTEQSVCILTGTGSAAMEAAVVNTLSPGDEVLCVVSGKFGERWADMCEAFGCHTHRLEIPWGHTLPLDLFEQALRQHSRVKAVLTQVCETSTATLHPVREMAALTRKHAPEALFQADAITAMGCLALPMDEWGLDVMVAGSQKAFMLPTGLSFIGLSARAWKAAETSQIKKYYFNLRSEKAANAKNQTYFSTPTPLIRGLDRVLSEMNQKGISQIQARSERLSEVTRETAAELGFATFSQSPSPSVTALRMPEGIPGEAFRDWLETERGLCVMGGQDQLKGQVLRIGHMGDISNDDMRAFFEALAAGADRWLKTDRHSTKWLSLASSVESRLKKVDKLFP